MRVSPAQRWRGRFRPPGDKSISHRLALFGALAQGPTVLRNFAPGQDGASTLRCLEQLGVEVHRQAEAVTVRGSGPGALRASDRPLDAGNSGSTLRMLAGLLAARPFGTTLSGDASLRRRPMERVAAPLRAMGARVETTDGCAPITIEGGALRGVDWTLPVASAQLKTAVLLAGLQAEGMTRVVEPGLSRDHTERWLPLFGVAVERSGNAVQVRGGARLAAVEAVVPGDPSSAAFLVVAALICPDAEVVVERVLLNPTRIGFLEVLREMGAEVTWSVESETPEPVGRIEARTSRLHGVRIGPERVPALLDEVPALAAAATAAAGTTTFEGVAELRLKESDRLAALAEGLGLLGARVIERPDGLVVEGGRPLRGARLRCHDDHRIAMALAVAALTARSDTELEGADCVAVSYPGFFTDLDAARGGGAA